MNESSNIISSSNSTPLSSNLIDRTCSTIYVSNIRHSTPINSIFNIFSKFGPLERCEIPENKFGKTRGFAFIEFENKANAHTAFEELNKQEILLDGRVLKLEWARATKLYKEDIQNLSSESKEKIMGTFSRNHNFDSRYSKKGNNNNNNNNNQINNNNTRKGNINKVIPTSTTASIQPTRNVNGMTPSTSTSSISSISSSNTTQSSPSPSPNSFSGNSPLGSIGGVYFSNNGSFDLNLNSLGNGMVSPTQSPLSQPSNSPPLSNNIITTPKKKLISPSPNSFIKKDISSGGDSPILGHQYQQYQYQMNGANQPLLSSSLSSSPNQSPIKKFNSIGHQLISSSCNSTTPTNVNNSNGVLVNNPLLPLPLSSTSQQHQQSLSKSLNSTTSTYLLDGSSISDLHQQQKQISNYGQYFGIPNFNQSLDFNLSFNQTITNLSNLDLRGINLADNITATTTSTTQASGSISSSSNTNSTTTSSSSSSSSSSSTNLINNSNGAIPTNGGSPNSSSPAINNGTSSLKQPSSPLPTAPLNNFTNHLQTTNGLFINNSDESRYLSELNASLHSIHHGNINNINSFSNFTNNTNTNNSMINSNHSHHNHQYHHQQQFHHHHHHQQQHHPYFASNQDPVFVSSPQPGINSFAHFSNSPISNFNTNNNTLYFKSNQF